jgi:hypothetical protein
MDQDFITARLITEKTVSNNYFRYYLQYSKKICEVRLHEKIKPKIRI